MTKITRISKIIFASFFIISFASAQVKYVTVTGAGLKDGSSWANAYDNLSFAKRLWHADSGTVFWLAKGTYKPKVDSVGNASPADLRTKTFSVNSRVVIYGGFAGNETSLSQRNISANLVILSGDINAIGDSTDNSYHVMRFSLIYYTDGSDYGVNGCTIRDGNANGSGTNGYGGGIFTVGYIGVFNCTFLNNNAESGGAIYHSDVGGVNSKNNFCY